MRAPSITRATSSAETTLSECLTATMAWLFVDSMWAPAIPTKALIALNPDCCSARLSEVPIASAVAWTSTMTPLRTPCDGHMPAPRISGWMPLTSAISVQTFVVPMSIPTMIWSRAIGTPPRRVLHGLRPLSPQGESVPGREQ